MGVEPMPAILNPELKRALAERIRYYNDLGIYDFYRREGGPSRAPAEESTTRESLTAELQRAEPMPRAKSDPVVRPVLPVLTATALPEQGIQDPVQALRAIREDIGD